MNLSPVAPSIVAGGCVVAPSLDARLTFGKDLAALGAVDVTEQDPFTLRASFADVPRGVTVANLVNDTLAGAKLVVDMPATGIPFQMSSSDVAQALRLLPGVTYVGDGMMSDRPVIDVLAASDAQARHLDQLLRDQVMLQGRGGPHAVDIRISVDQPVIPFNG